MKLAPPLSTTSMEYFKKVSDDLASGKHRVAHTPHQPTASESAHKAALGQNIDIYA